MLTLAQAVKRATDSAISEGRPVAVLCLNQFVTNGYVLRAYDGRPERWAFVAFPQPE